MVQFIKMKKYSEYFGWYGVIAILLAYICVSFSVIQPTSLTYQILNGTGAIGIVVVSLYKKAYQPAILNMFWAIIAIIVILKILF